MKQKLLLKTMLLLFALIAGSSSVWADETITLTQANLELTGSYSSNAEKTIGDVTFTHTDLMKSTDYIQAKASTGFIGNKTAFPQNIKSVAITHNATARATTILGSADGTNWTQIATGSGSITGDFTSGSYKYFKITRGSNAAYWSQIVITYESSGSGPSISANAVNLAFDATNGSIGYTISNPSTPAGTLTAAITAGNEGLWLSTGTVTSTTVPLTCSANPTNDARSATVTLTYTYNTNQTVTKNVTVTQAANPNVFDNISSITAVSTTYQVKGTVVATSAKGLVIGDGTGYVYYYNNAAVTQSIGDKITISGTTGSYNHVLQFPNTATVNEAATSSYDNTPAVTVVDADAIATYNEDLHLSDYVQFQGALAKDNNNNYNITVGTATARISYPTDAQKTALNALVSKTVRVKGYFTGFTSSNFTVMLESAEEVAVPTITATPSSRSGFFYMPGNGPSAAKTISVAGSNLTADISLSASTNYEMCLTEDGVYASSLTLTQTAGAVTATTVYVRLKAGLTSNDYDGTITLTSTGADNVIVNLSGSVVATASLPFSWTGTSSAGSAELDAKTGVEVYLGSDYAGSNAPYRLKFDGTTRYVVIYTDEKPEVVAFTAKIFGAAETGSKIKVQESADGITFTDVQEFTIKGAANATFQFTTTEAFAANSKAVKLIMSAKDQNVGVGTLAIAGSTSLPITPAKEYTTLTSDFPLDFTGLANLEAYIVKDNDTSDGYVTLTKVNKVPANTGLVLKASSTGSPIDVPVLAGDADDVTGNLMKGSATATTPVAENAGYILKDGVFQPSSGGDLPAGKAYLNIAVSSAPVLNLNFGDVTGDGNTTGVNDVRSKMEEGRGEFYNLNGQRVAQPTKGLYIVNGKKYVVK